MPTYNHEPYVSAAIESVLSQRVKAQVELVIGDDCSTDATGEICQGYADRFPSLVKYSRRPENVGLARNICTTWSDCDGQYIAMLEGDDLWMSPVKLHRQIELMDQHPEYSMCFTVTRTLVDGDGGRARQWPYYQRNKLVYTLTECIRHNMMANCSVMYRSILPRPVHFWFPWLLRLPNLDMAFHGLHGWYGPIGFVNEWMAVYRLHPGSSFECKALCEKVNIMTMVYEALADGLPEPYCHQARQTLVLMHQGLLLWALRHHNGRAFAGHLARAVGNLRSLPPKYRLVGPTLAAEELWHLVRSR